MRPTPGGSSELILPDPLMPLIRHCQVLCVVACCGRDAFDRDPKHLLPWLREHPDQFSAVLDQLSDAVRWVGEQHSEIISELDGFNAVWNTPEECGQFLREWRETIHRAAEKAYGRALSAVDPQWLTSTVVALAQGIYDDRAFDRLPILADALQDAGCENADVLNHCRDGNPHARGCWVVDLVLGKS